ncbi:PDZ domain-containing protein [Phocaeicola coprophilus]|uniref:PDZ domain-containing protein n=1 Tax=Phocaeicola coprophilus TaxID=387090 RepID=UPI00307724EF
MNLIYTFSHLRRQIAWAAGCLCCCLQLNGQVIYVSTRGNDKWNGSEKKPVASLVRAQELARAYGRDTSVEIVFEDGIYYLPGTVQFTGQDSKDYPATVTLRARHEGKAVISGGQQIRLDWKQEAGNIYVASVPAGMDIDQLYVAGLRQPMARFPNAQPGKQRNVYDTWVLDHQAQPNPEMDPLQPERIALWKNPEGGYVHAMHTALWGDMHWEIKGKNEDGTLQLEGGWQNNRPSGMHPLYRFVENIKEELDVPGEWYYDRSESKLYYMPLPEIDLDEAKVEIVRLKHLIEFNGTKENPVRGIHLQGLTFKHTARTFMENKEQLLRSDWTMYRGGAIVFNGAEECSVENCEFDHLGGNTIFVNNYNRYLTVRGCYIHHSGANGIVFVGDPDMVRSPLFRYGNQNYETMDMTPGPLGDNYPQDCWVDDCLITMTGRDEKQTAPVQISMSQRIRVSHCSIYDVPRAGININEGTFGGHIIEFCDVFNTVLETGDHGSFNSWGRDRFWTPDVVTISDQVALHPDMQYWDVLEPNVLRYNRWRCDHGWDVDLDDGSSFYRIYCNLLLNGGLKMREGYDRVATNNIILNNSLHPHVWVRNSDDVFKHNIVFTAYQPAVMNSALGESDRWGKELDYNLFATGQAAMRKFAAHGADAHSVSADPLFVNPGQGDFRVRPESPAFKIGFRNFDMTDFGVKSEKLKKLARTPDIPEIVLQIQDEVSAEYTWLGAVLKEVKGEELSAYGAKFSQASMALDRVPAESEAYKLGLRSGDLLLSLGGKEISTAASFKQLLEEYAGKSGELFVMRNQKEMVVK